MATRFHSKVLLLMITLAVMASSLPCKADNFGKLFTGSPCGSDGERGCTGTCNPHWTTYFKVDPAGTSFTMTAGNDCRTVSTAESCLFSIGDDGVTEISFDFEVSDECHPSAVSTVWLSFWLYSKPWNNHVEVDFIESLKGPGTGLNTNFSGPQFGNQVVIFAGGPPPPTWKGSITALFKGSGDSVNVTVSNSVNTNIGTATLQRSAGYFFVLDTTPTTLSGCTVTISDLAVTGKAGVGTKNCSTTTCPHACCYANASATDKELADGLSWACSPTGGGVDCGPLNGNGACHELDLRQKANYAFNSYWQSQKAGATCSFGGAASEVPCVPYPSDKPPTAGCNGCPPSP